MPDEYTSTKRRHREKGDEEKKSKKRHKHHDDDKERKHKSKRKRTDEGKSHIRDDDMDEDVWVEKNIDMEGEQPLATDIPTAESLKLKSNVNDVPPGAEVPPSRPTESTLKRDDWMLMEPEQPTVPQQSSTIPTAQDDSLTDGYGEPSGSSRTLGGGVDFFSSLGTEHRKKPPPKPLDEKPKISSRELNADMLQNPPPPDDNEPPPPPKKNVPGGPGSSWRMMRLRKVYEAAEEDGLSIEAVAIDRFGSLEAFEEAKEERRILDEREGRRSQQGYGSQQGNGSQRGYGSQGRQGSGVQGGGPKGMMFNDLPLSGASSRSSSFRKPGQDSSVPGTPSPPANRRLDSLRLPSQAGSKLAQSHTPIPSVMTPPVGVGRSGSSGGGSRAGGKRAMSPSSLNKLQAKVLRAKLMGSPDAEALEKEYEAEQARANGADDGDDGGQSSGVRTQVEVLPTLDGRGRLYDVGLGREEPEAEKKSGNRKKKEKIETRDPKTGELIRINADDDELTLGEMLRQERFGAGQADQKDLDAQFARAIMTDGKFENDLDYIDDNAEKLGRQKMRTDAMKRQFAIHDYKKTQQVLSSCIYCYGADDSPPKAPVVAMGTRAYLACTTSEELVPGHCLIVPIQHHLNMLEADDDVWDEVKNFMKCLMRMFAEEDKGVVFYETVISLKWQAHTVIECVPLPWEQFEVIPGYFKESILASEAEWSQHKKLIDFSARPGGFRRAMVPNLPYFAIQFDYKGEKGYGHVIEGGATADGDEEGVEEGEKGGGEFPKYFAGEIIGNVLDLEPRKWRRPKRIDFHSNKQRVAQFKQKYDQFDWTPMIGQS
ncbi:uncharacterized protein SCHCODRAFT_02615633 [Schizophyllum commune H4-8]|uniref:Cwf19-like C-terminal domain-containing protein n=1 Tax=Schizophyllum commune (strain H4-8 / FGSC 9210) TaxID=578458 RepID=D8Q0A6_SCHCM|nr:uncharacterized protein SCHCODRAFT_02615633 [Schizophyllum commune H4-8]KAI5896716.1 hypothetical protein SCHCODRAFT_02615633 [Schizophyllum commune H4-8]